MQGPVPKPRRCSRPSAARCLCRDIPAVGSSGCGPYCSRTAGSSRQAFRCPSARPGSRRRDSVLRALTHSAASAASFGVPLLNCTTTLPSSDEPKSAVSSVACVVEKLSMQISRMPQPRIDATRLSVQTGPSSRNGFNLSGDRFWTTRSCATFRIVRASAAPIRPRPMTEIPSTSSLLGPNNHARR